MPCPKHKPTRRMGRNRRASNHLVTSRTSKCPRCNEEKRSHRACMNCGFYKDSDVLGLE